MESCSRTSNPVTTAGRLKERRWATFANQEPVSGFQGKGLVNSYIDGDRPVGKLISDSFVIEKPFVNLLVGGGKSGQTRIEIQVDGKPVLQTFGKDDEKLEAATWDVTPWIGMEARIWIIDNSSGGWGHINVDHIVFSDHRIDQPYRPIPVQPEIAAVAENSGLDSARLLAWCKILASVDAKSGTPEALLSQWTLDQKVGRLPNWKGYAEALAKYQDETELFADFSGTTLPKGWTTTGDAFVSTGDRKTLRFDPENPIAEPGTVDSGALGRNHVGTLRSPTFEIRPGAIHIRQKTKNAMVRVVIDNYHMAVYQSLLFRGTVLTKTDTEGEFHWHQIAGNLSKYVGHRAYLEFVDAGDGFVAVDEVRFSSRGPVARKPHPLVLALLGTAAPETDAQVASLLDKAWETGDPGVLNWLSRNQLITLGDVHPGLATLLDEGVQLAGALPPARFAVAMAQGTSEQAQVYIRGSHKSRGPEVPNRYLEAFGAVEGTRLDLANQMADLAPFVWKRHRSNG